jgi:hypothetical protein
MRTPAEEIVNFLGFSSSPGHRLASLRSFRQREWKDALSWLDDAGLAFYFFLRKIKDTLAVESPASDSSKPGSRYGRAALGLRNSAVALAESGANAFGFSRSVTCPRSRS